MVTKQQILNLIVIPEDFNNDDNDSIILSDFISSDDKNKKASFDFSLHNYKLSITLNNVKYRLYIMEVLYYQLQIPVNEENVRKIIKMIQDEIN